MALVDESLTRVVIAAFYAVFNTLGSGLPENVYAGALEHECRKRGLHVGREIPIPVTYDGVIVGTFRVDLLIERRLVLEIKACPPHKDHYSQLLNYLRCADLKLGLLLYFIGEPNVRRIMRRTSEETNRQS